MTATGEPIEVEDMKTVKVFLEDTKLLAELYIPNCRNTYEWWEKAGLLGGTFNHIGWILSARCLTAFGNLVGSATGGLVEGSLAGAWQPRQGSGTWIHVATWT